MRAALGERGVNDRRDYGLRDRLAAARRTMRNVVAAAGLRHLAHAKSSPNSVDNIVRKHRASGPKGPKDKAWNRLLKVWAKKP